jgi:hypothetical protein
LHSEALELNGHIIDSLILPRVLDTILDLECDFIIEEFRIGVQKTDPSYARLKVTAGTGEALNELVETLQRLGASVVEHKTALATMLHTIATGNVLPAGVRFIAVDINPAVATKLADRGSFQNIGIVTDVSSFLRDLCDELHGVGHEDSKEMDGRA